jgi:hypothetical protein
MTREETFLKYKVEGDRIVSPGKFEGQPVFAPYFWSLVLEGFADSDDGKVWSFNLKLGGQDKDNPFLPELKRWLGRKRTLKLVTDSQELVHCF